MLKVRVTKLQVLKVRVRQIVKVKARQVLKIRVKQVLKVRGKLPQVDEQPIVATSEHSIGKISYS